MVRGAWCVVRDACACAWKGEFKKRDVRGEIIKKLNLRLRVDPYGEIQ